LGQIKRPGIIWGTRKLVKRFGGPTPYKKKVVKESWGDMLGEGKARKKATGMGIREKQEKSKPFSMQARVRKKREVRLRKEKGEKPKRSKNSPTKEKRKQETSGRRHLEKILLQKVFRG